MFKSITRTLSFFAKWMAEIVRQPSLMLSLVVGPFLLLLAFGQGVMLVAPKPRTLIVVPEQPGDQHQIDPSPERLEKYLEIVGTTTSLDEARDKLVEGDVDLVAVLPPHPLETIKQGKRAPILTLTNEIDPVRKMYAHAYLHDQVATLNQQTLERAIEDAQGSSIDRLHSDVLRARQQVQALRASQGDIERSRQQIRTLKAVIDPLAVTAEQAAVAAQGASFVIPGYEQPADQGQRLTQSADNLKRSVDELDARLAAGGTASPEELARIERDLNEIERLTGEIQRIPAWVLSAPFNLEMENVAPFLPTYIGFYAPAVLALLLQHLGVTLAALSMSRIRLLGLMELLRTSPVRPAEVVVGNYLSYGVLCAIAGALLVVLLVFALGVPMWGSWAAFAGVLALLVLCSLGIGFVISMISSSEQQAAQLSMLVLIASVFLGGFMVSLNMITWPVRALSYLLPATYAIRSLQDVMLRGVLRTPADLGVLAGGAIALFVVTILLFRREYRPG